MLYMKLIINYDLINEINKANTGIDFQRLSTKSGIYLGTITTLNLTTFALGQGVNPIGLTTGIFYAAFIFGGSELALRSINTQQAENRLRNLSSSLTKINIYTDTESIKKARLYKTKYKVVRTDGKTFLQQNKYIMLPTDGTFNADEVSLLQEHNIGAREYVLSMGEPKKAHSKSLSKVFARQMQ